MSMNEHRQRLLALNRHPAFPALQALRSELCLKYGLGWDVWRLEQLLACGYARCAADAARYAAACAAVSFPAFDPSSAPAC